ncbi:hypothetical protein [Streptomyces sp. NBC_00859]|uniref:hypothetical protein n=1 Tax=Streptomyces sp. NBC_00859 TaxID=2903682 RepID=UPI00386B945C|nr:hypothetical protein OG584_32465 [Streptomyces sp. NBC_00859]
MTSSSKVVRYLLGGLLIGGFWYLNRGRPLWEEALRTIIVFAVVMFLMKSRLKRRSIDVHLVPLIASKAALVAVAALVESRIEGSVGNPALVVAIGLGLGVILLGPLGDGHYFTRQVPSSASAPARQVR